MIKLLKVLVILIYSSSVFAQISLMQGDPNIKWKKISNKYFEIVYPKGLKPTADYIISQLNYFRPLVTKSYQYQPKKVSIVLRSKMAEPNGFVTLAPRRSEWYAGHNITPLVGSLNWYQSLAVHEYRHVVQIDHLNQGYTSWGYALFGEQILGILVNIVMPSWYFEGDAVWAETAYTDGGRGRSPRFAARLKTLLTQNETPSYDALLAGDFNNVFPNLYVYGYFLVANAYKKYGKDVWKKIATRAADSPWNFWAFYNAFEEVTHKNFDVFYYETMDELKTQWSDSPITPEVNEYEYSQVHFIKFDQDKKYTLRSDLSHFRRLFEGEKELTELNISPDLSKADLKQGIFLYVQNVIDSRYMFKNYSDLYIFDIKKNEHRRLTESQRLFHPNFSPDGSKIITVSYNENENTELKIFDLEGQLLETRSHPIPNYQYAEAIWKNDFEIYTISLDPNGHKQIDHINLLESTLNHLTHPTRNNIFNLILAEDELFFETDYLGVVQIHKLDLKTQKAFSCTQESIMAKFPSLYKDQIYYTSYGINGSKIASMPNLCHKELDSNFYLDKNYIGNTPSDNFVSEEGNNFVSPKITSHKEADYQESSGVFSPHSWNFLFSRGTSLEVNTQNTIGTMSATALAGLASESNTPLASFRLEYSKYYPVFSIYGNHQKREATYIQGSSKQEYSWDENIYGANITLPYLYQNHLFSGINLLSLGSAVIDINGETGSNSSSSLNDNKLTTKDISFRSSYSKALTRRQLIPSFSYLFNSLYVDLETEKNNQTNYFAQFQLDFTFEMPYRDHGLYLKTNRQIRPKDKSLYRFQNANLLLIDYTFSRGYAYEFTPEFNKYTLEYKLPLYYPTWKIADYFYFNRVYGTFFYDHTDVELNEQRRTLNSYGFELNLNSNTFRKFPVTYGFRYYTRETDKSSQGEFFISLFSN